MLDAAVRRVPVTGGVERVSAPEGSSLAQFVALAFPVETHRRFVVVAIDGEEIAPEAWDRVPRAGEVVSLVFRPGGKDFFRTILQIAVIAVAVWVSGGGLGGVFAAGSWQAAVAAAGVSILGNLAINSLIPLSKPGSVEAAPPYYSLSNARNAERLMGRVPMLFGTHRIAPPRIAKPIQEVGAGGTTFLRIALCLGLCPMQATDWKIGDTPLSSFTGVEMEVRLTEDAPAHTLFSGDIDQEAVGATLAHDTWTTRTTATDVDEIEIINDFPAGLGGLDSKGRKTARTVQLRIQYRPAGSSDDWSDWRPDVAQANAASAAAGAPYRPEYFTLNEDLVGWQAELDGLGGVANGIYAITRSDAGRAFRDAVRFAVPRGQYEVRQQRVAAVSTDPNVADAVSWSVLSSIRSAEDPFPNRKLATACFRIQASDQLANMVDTLNCIATSLQPVFSAEALADPTIADAGEFASVEASSNPLELALLAARGANTNYPKPDAEIDWPAFASAAAKCATRGWTFNAYIEEDIGRWEMIRRILAAAHARPVKHNGKLSVVMDDSKAGQAPAQVFTPRNVRNFRWRKTYPRLAHAVKAAFANADNAWQADEVTVFLPGQSEETATIYETIAMPGKTDADEIRTFLNQYARNAYFQTEAFEFETDSEYLTVKRGDYAVVQHHAMATGIGASRIRSVETNGGGAVTAVVFDTVLDAPAKGILAVQWRHIVVDGGFARMEVLGEQLVTRDEANPKRFVFVTPQSGATKPAGASGDYEGDLALLGLSEKVSFEVLVRDITPRPHLQAAISCVAYAGERFIDAPDWPAHDPKVTLPYAPRPTAPVALGSATATQLEIAVPFRQPDMPRGVTLSGYTVARREHGSAGDSWEPRGSLRADERVAVLPAGDPGAKYDVRIVAFGHRDDGATVYSDALVVSEIAAATAPAQPAGCSAAFSTRTSSGGAQQLVLTAAWTANENPDVLDTVVEQRVSTGPDVWQEIGRGRAAAGKTEIHGLPVGRDYVLGFVNLSRRGAPSARTVISSISAPDTLVATGALAAVPGSSLAGDIAAAATSSDAAAAAAAVSASLAATEASAAAASALTASSAATAASGSATAAAGSATSASNSATTAGGHATSAASSASAAAASASGAAGSASAASTSASAASTSASAASTSASAAATSATNAATSAGSASTSATNASSSATTAAGHASTASTQATNAANSATAAGASASSASSSASSASTSASAASTSASAAATSATNAATSAGSASTSATNASTSATTAAGHASTASTAATAAASSQSAAAGSASAASTSASTASTQASNAATSASAAATSATSASTQASNAATSASSASTSAGNAASSATSAGTHASNAAGSASSASSSASAASASSTAASSSATLAATYYGKGNRNLFPNPSGNGSGASAIGAGVWAGVFGGDTSGSGFLQIRIDWLGGNLYYEGWGSYSSGSNRNYYIDIPLSSGTYQNYTVSWLGWTAGFTTAAVVQAYILDSGGGTVAVSSQVSLSNFSTGVRSSVTVGSSGATGVTIRIYVVIPAQTVGAYCGMMINQIKLEPGSSMTAFTDDASINNLNNGLATANANIATNASAIATESAARASLSTLVTARVGATPGSEMPNPAFSAWANPAAWPDGWVAWNSGTMDGRTTGRVGQYGVYVGAAGGSNAGLSCSKTNATPGKKVIEICMERTSGNWTGSGVYVVTFTDNTFATSIEGHLIDLSNTADVEGITSAGTGMGVRRWRVPLTFHANTGAVLIIGMNHWSSIGSIASYNQFIWHQLDVVPVDYGAAQAQINAGAVADLNSGAAWIEQVVAAGGGDLGAFRLRAGKAGSFIELISTVLRLANISNGSVIEVMRAVGGEAYFSRPVSIDFGGARMTIGPGYGVSGSQLFLWVGADTFAPSAQSRTNGAFAIGSDKKIYYGAAELVATTVDKETKTGTAAFDNVTTSGTTLHTMATIDLTVGASGYLELLSPLFYGPLSINQETGMTLSAGTDWFGQMIVTEQLQSGGTETTLWTIPLQISDTGGGLFDFIFDPPVTKVVAQNVSGASRYRLKLQRTSGSNNVSGNGLQGKFTIRRTP